MLDHISMEIISIFLFKFTYLGLRRNLTSSKFQHRTSKDECKKYFSSTVFIENHPTYYEFIECNYLPLRNSIELYSKIILSTSSENVHFQTLQFLRKNKDYDIMLG